MKCPYCGSERIETGIKWGQSYHRGNPGLKHSHGSGFIKKIEVATVYSDLCLDCKAILKTYIQEDTNKNWEHKSEN